MGKWQGPSKASISIIHIYLDVNSKYSVLECCEVVRQERVRRNGWCNPIPITIFELDGLKWAIHSNASQQYHALLNFIDDPCRPLAKAIGQWGMKLKPPLGKEMTPIKPTIKTFNEKIVGIKQTQTLRNLPEIPLSHISKLTLLTLNANR